MKSNLSEMDFKGMQCFMALIDHVHPHVEALAESFGIEKGYTVVDYGCGPGRYTVEFARLTGEDGVVYAVDLLDIALRETGKRLQKQGVQNVVLKRAEGYATGVPDGAADMVFAIDMFHHVDNAPAFLKEAARISKPEAGLIFSGGHLPRKILKERITEAGLWFLAEENNSFLLYKKTGA